MYTTLISVDQLQTLQASGQSLRVFDCSFELLQPQAGDAQYLQSHIFGAVRADLDRHLCCFNPAQAMCGGRHPLPTREALAQWLGSVGLTADMQAVVYDRQGVNYCGRLWWLLKWVGHEAVAVLDGGLQAWQAAGAAIESGESTSYSASNYPLAPATVAWVATEDVVNNLGRPHQTILDARARPRYLGELEPIDPVAGHIPGALNRPFADNLDASGRFKSPDQLRREFEALLAGRDPATVVHHCGSGVSAIPNVLAMEVAGMGRTKLYAGSWSEWCRDSARPVAKG
jgi:thiosulfate/3-mercaptopyruvate sulfurtransferase